MSYGLWTIPCYGANCFQDCLPCGVEIPFGLCSSQNRQNILNLLTLRDFVQLWIRICGDQFKSREEIIRDVMGLKAPRTAYKRANDLLRCFQFHVDKLDCAWPWDTKSVASYLKTLEGSKGEASATLGLFQAMTFAFHVLDIPLDTGLSSDRRMQGRAKRLVADSGPLKQAEALTVQQVIQVERKMVDSNTCDQDKFLVGGMLFTLFSRSRWSDHKHLDFLVFDLDEKGEGFIEAQTRHHKTRNMRKASKRAMPLVCPAVSLAGVDWISAWFKAGVNLGFK